MVAIGCHGIVIMPDDKRGMKQILEGARPRALRTPVQPVGSGTALALELAPLHEARRIAGTLSLPGAGVHSRYQSEVQVKSCNLPEKGHSSAF